MFLLEIKEIVFLVALIGLFYSFFLFYNGIHNVDLAWNGKYFQSLPEFQGRYFVDLGSDFVVRDFDEAYILGFNGVLNGYFLFFFSILLIYFSKFRSLKI